MGLNEPREESTTPEVIASRRDFEECFEGSEIYELYTQAYLNIVDGAGNERFATEQRAWIYSQEFSHTIRERIVAIHIYKLRRIREQWQGMKNVKFTALREVVYLKIIY